jgi:POT family proton-dependent oligopeptide transporter
MNSHLLEKVYMWFYFSINVGASLSAFAIPLILQHFGPQLAFGLPGLLMLLATFAFWMGRNKFVHIPPKGVVVFKEAFSKEGLATIGKLGSIYIFIAVFWALFDQTGSSWIQQAEKMDLYFMGRQWLPSQVQSINGILILVYIPLFSKVIYPKINQYLNFSPLRKIGTGLFITVISFLVPAFVQTQIEAGITPSIAWHILAFAILTAGEVLVSITTLEFSYTQASNSLKSVVMALFLLSVSIGNLFTSAVNFILINPDGSTKLTGTEYFLFFSGLMLIVSFLYIPVAMAFKVQNHVQDEEENRPG